MWLQKEEEAASREEETEEEEEEEEAMSGGAEEGEEEEEEETGLGNAAAILSPNTRGRSPACARQRPRRRHGDPSRPPAWALRSARPGARAGRGGSRAPSDSSSLPF